MNGRSCLALLALLTLAACSTGPAPLPAPAIHAAPPPTSPFAPRRTARIFTAPGLEGVIGADSDALTRQFGPPRLDVQEGDARKLQWSGTACVLDAYLYPPESGGRAATTYVDARRGDGRDVDRAACVAALRQAPRR